MPSFDLKPIAASLESSIPFESFPALNRWFLSLKCKLDIGECLAMSTGEREHEIDFVMNFKAETSEHTNWLREKVGFQKAIGAAHYFAPRDGEKAKVFFETDAPSAEMQMLLAFAREGRFPNRVTVAIDSEAITYGYAPDGSEKKWDATKAFVPIHEVSFTIPVSQEDAGEQMELDGPKTPVGIDLVPDFRKLSERLMWTVYLLLALGVILLFKK